MNKKHTDKLYASPQAVSGFIFDDKVAAVFPDMIQRSVPGYGTIIHMIAQLASRYATANSHCYDLGCSLGAAAPAMRSQLDADVTVIGVDSSAAMLARCRSAAAAGPETAAIELRCEDILDTDIQRASVVVLNFTLQFIALAQREHLIANIYKGMLPGGILVLSEKLCFDNRHHNDLMVALHHYFKRSNGYSELEVAQKRAALENVLLPETLPTHQQRLRSAGFQHVDLWFQCFNFVSMIAIK